jgi:UDP-GlcNAc3NAcA epimerase
VLRLPFPMRIISIVGARPQFIKVAALCRALAISNTGERVCHGIIHTGQHYDDGMSDVFFRELGIPAPAYNLGVGSGTHGVQTGEMMKRLEPVLMDEKPDWVVLYGDTNSTTAGALVAAKLDQPLAHVEAGLRSYNRQLPEELNRIVADHLSDLLFCPTPLSVENLRKEGLGERALLTGDVMYDAALMFREVAESHGGPLADAWQPGKFALATVHRASNTDDPERLCSLLATLDEIAEEICPVVLPLHPRTHKILSGTRWKPKALCIIPPVSYLEMLLLEGRARFILTDSGGVQKEAYFVQAPCITLREETEWQETLENNCNVLTGGDRERIKRAAAAASAAGPWTAAYGDGHAGAKILAALSSRQPRK